MIITSKFDGACTKCGKAVRAGDRVWWERGLRGVQHAACSAGAAAVVQAVAASRAEDADVDVPCPAGLAYRGYQRAGVAYMLGRRGTLLADEMGVGKTIQAIGLINACSDMAHILVVCPHSLKINWKNELDRWLVRPAQIVVEGGRTYAHAGAGALLNIRITNPERLKDVSPPAGGWSLAVLDEGHFYKNEKTKRTKAAKLHTRAAKRVVVLTGTPVPNRPVELFPLLSMIDAKTWDPASSYGGRALAEGEGGGFFRFARRYCAAHKEQVARGKEVWVFDGSSNLPELQERLRSTCMIRRTKAVVLKELGAKVRQVVELPHTRTEEDDLDVGDEYETAHRKVTAIPFERMSEMRAKWAKEKAPLAVEHVSDLLEGDAGKAVVFAHHHTMIDALAEGLSAFGVVAVDGRTADAAVRQAAVDRFQADPACRVFIGSMKAAGVGITLTAASTVVFAEADWVPSTMTQAEDRCHRLGQTETVNVQVLVLQDTLDARMVRMCAEKQAVADAALDDEASYSGEGREDVAARRAAAVREAHLTEEEIEQIHGQIKYLAGRCDGAIEQDGAGFNKFDANIGRDLAGRPSLSPRQAAMAKKMLGKYRRQLEGAEMTLESAAAH